jgi:hypothetical protein
MEEKTKTETKRGMTSRIADRSEEVRWMKRGVAGRRCVRRLCVTVKVTGWVLIDGRCVAK